MWARLVGSRLWCFAGYCKLCGKFSSVKLRCWEGLSCPDAEPFGFTFYTASETLALPGSRCLIGLIWRKDDLRRCLCGGWDGRVPRGLRACCRLLVLAEDVLFGRRPCGRLLPSTTRRSAMPSTSRRSARAECKAVLHSAIRAVAWAYLAKGWPTALFMRWAGRSRSQGAPCLL